MPDHVAGGPPLLARLAGVFRTLGYGAASLSQLEQRTGRARSSLYHWFPGGKEDMAVAVVDAAAASFVEHVLAPDRASDVGPEARLAVIAERLDDYYDGGTTGCLMETLSTSEVPAVVADRVRRAAEQWLGTFADIAVAAGHDRAQAGRRARRAIASVEGALVLARATGDVTAFREALADLPAVLVD